MRHILCVLTILLLLLLLLFNVGVEVFAMNTGFSTESLPDDEIKTFLKNVNISMLAGEPQKEAIKCFDVGKNGVIAVGCGKGDTKTVCIYNSTGVFLYGYSFQCNGSFGIELDESVINIYFVRSDVAISVNAKGDVESILKIKNTPENNAYWNNCVFLTNRKTGDAEYTLKNNMGFFNIFAASYSQLIVTNKDGETSILYDVNSAEYSNMVTRFIGVLVFVCLVVAAVIWQFFKLKRGS